MKKEFLHNARESQLLGPRTGVQESNMIINVYDYVQISKKILEDKDQRVRLGVLSFELMGLGYKLDNLHEFRDKPIENL